MFIVKHPVQLFKYINQLVHEIYMYLYTPVPWLYPGYSSASLILAINHELTT